MRAEVEIQHFVHHRKLSFPLNKSATADYSEFVVYDIIDTVFVFVCQRSCNITYTPYAHEYTRMPTSPSETRFCEPLKTRPYMYTFVHVSFDAMPSI